MACQSELTEATLHKVQESDWLGILHGLTDGQT